MPDSISKREAIEAEAELLRRKIWRDRLTVFGLMVGAAGVVAIFIILLCR